MSNTIFITANWTTGALSQQTISRQYDNNRYAVQFIGYPEGDGTEELDLYLLVWMSTAPGQKPGEITPIQLNSDQWYISNYFTQQVQVIKFQLCVLNEAGTYEAHSPIFSGRIGDSLEHNGTSHDIDVSTLFDAYREYVEELIIGAGAVIIDPVPTQGSTNAVQSGGVYSALDTLQAQIPQIDSTLSQSGQAADAKVVRNKFDETYENLLGTTSLSDWIYNKAFSIGAVGDTVDINAEENAPNYRYQIVAVENGDSLIVNGATGSSSRQSCVLLDSQYKILSYFGTAMLENWKIVITNDCAYVLLQQRQTNSFFGFGVCYKSKNTIKENIRSLQYVETDISERLHTIDRVYQINPDDWFIGNVTINNEGWTYQVNNKNRVCLLPGVTYPLKAGDIIELSDYSDARFFVGYYKDGQYYTNGKWQTDGYYTAPADGDYKIVIGNTTNKVQSDKYDLLSLIHIFANTVESEKHSVFELMPNACYDHLFVNNAENEITIPHESVFHVRASKKFGFKTIEANVQSTSDGVYFVNHLISGKFGRFFHHVDGTTDISDIAANTVTWEWIATNVRYNSLIEKYRTRPATLEEFLGECKQNGLIPFLQTKTDENIIKIADKIMGVGNYIAYGATRDIAQNGVIYAWVTTLTNKDDIVAYCKNIGKPLIYGFGNIGSMTMGDAKEIIDALHENGFYVGVSYADNRWSDYAYIGVDFNGTQQMVNRIESGNLYNIDSMYGFNEFTFTNATEVNEILTFTADGTLSPNISNNTYPMSMFDMEIWFKGTIQLPATGEAQSTTYSSDGTTPVFFAVPIINGSPKVTISVTNGTTIYDVKYKASRV